MTTALRALQSRNFRVFFIGQGFSVFGTWMQTVATSWLVYRLTGSAFMLGLATGALQLPMLFLSPIAGVWADRMDRRRLLIIVQSLAAVQGIVVAAIVFAGAVEVWHLIAASLFLGVINAIETPTRQANLLELVPSKADLPNAIALQSMLFNGARFIGPTIAGVILAFAGEALCFLLNGLSYVAVVVAYWMIQLPVRPLPTARAAILTEIIEGFRYAFGSLAMRRLILLLGVLSFFTAPWQSLMPIFAAETFAGDSRTLGTLIGAVGLGGIAALAMLAMRPSVRGLGKVIAACSLLAGLTLLGFSLSQIYWLSLALLPLFGFGLITAVASSNTILQTIADDAMRGRIISIYVMTFLGVAPIANFIGGLVAEAIGAHWTVFACGLGLALFASWFTANLPSWRKSIRPLYLKHGIIPDARD